MRANIWLSMALLVGCGQGALDLNGRAVTGETLGDAEVFYLEDAYGAVVLNASTPFEFVEFHSSLADAQMRVLDADGAVVADWAHLSTFVDDSDPVAYEGALNLEDSAQFVELRLDSPVEFGRFVVGAGAAHGHEGEVDLGEAEGGITVQRAHSGRWIPPAHVVNAGNQQYLPYTGAPDRCSGTMLPGTRALARHLVAAFAGGRSYGGYSCRANTADPSSLSVHASGRAIDLFVPLHGTQADNDLGDPIANYLIENASRLGVEFIVWDRTSWGAHRAAPKHRYYSGPHPHHDHLHIELAPWAANNANIDKSPRGHVDTARCTGISGWAQDPDAPHQPIEVYVSIGGPIFTPGAHGKWALANERRDDLCSAIGSCNHGWYTTLPHGAMDGVEREVYAYGIDRTGGQNAQLMGVKKVRCGKPALPYGANNGVKRPIPNPQVFARWGFEWNDIIRVSDATLNAFPSGLQLPNAPTLRKDGAPVYLVEGGTKRHVPNPRAMNAWGLEWGEIRTADMAGHATKPRLEARPFLIQGSGPGVYLLWPK